MKMANGGYNIAYNVQFATGTTTRVIYGVNVVSGEDPGEAVPMALQVFGVKNELKLPDIKYWLADANYAGKNDIEDFSKTFPYCQYYAAPKKKSREKAKRLQKKDSKEMANWRLRIDSPEVEQAYSLRISTAEFSNAQSRNKGFNQFLVRGIDKANSSALLHAIVHNFQRYQDLKEQKRAD